MIAYRFGRDDLLRTRFAISPLFELAASLRVLRDPGGHSVHLPWAREARARLAGLDYSLLDALHPSGPYAPDFVAPPPQTPLPDVRGGARARARDPAGARAARGRVDVRGRARCPPWRARCSTTRRARCPGSPT